MSTQCAGSSGGSQPPHGNHSRISMQCEDDYMIEDSDDEQPPPPPKKKQGERGIAKGYKVQALKKKYGGRIPLIWDPRFPEVGKTVGPHQKDFDSETGRVVRAHVPCYFRTWEEVDSQYKEIVWNELKSSFEPLGRIHHPFVLQSAGKLYRKWKSNLKARVKMHIEKGFPGPCPPPKNVGLKAHWDLYLRLLPDKTYQKKCEQNARNRSANQCIGNNGRKPVRTIRFERSVKSNLIELEDCMGEDPIAVWARTHQNEDGSWINAACEANYRKLLEWRALVAPGRQMTFDEERTIFEGVFGRRRDSVIGLGPIPNKSAREASQPSPTSTFQQDHLNEIQQLRRNQDRLEMKLKKSEMKRKRTDNLLKEVLTSINPKRKFNMPSSSDDVDGSDDDDGYDDGYDGYDDGYDGEDDA